MKIEYDREVDALYIRIQETYVATTKEIADGIHVDFDEAGKVIGFEILDATDRYSQADILNLATENLLLGGPVA